MASRRTDGLHLLTHEIEAFALGLLDELDTSRAANHVQECDACAERVDRVPLRNDPFLTTVRAAARRAPGRAAATDRTVATSGNDRATLAAIRKIGRYRLLRSVGTGGFGEVWEAHDDLLQRTVALKIPHRHRVATPQAVEAILSEARSAAGLQHPAIVPVYDFGQADGTCCYIVMQYIQGTDLAARIRGSQPTPHQAVEWVAAIADGLQYAHQAGIIHRDIKPANILLDASGKPLLADFGLALKLDRRDSQPFEGGTLAYLAPEIVRDPCRVADEAADLWALGVVLYEMLTGRRPFEAPFDDELAARIGRERPPAPRRLRPGIPAAIEAVCLRALAPDPGQRFETAAQFAAALRAAGQGTDIPPRAARRFWLAAIVGLLSLCLIWAMFSGNSNPLPLDVRETRRIVAPPAADVYRWPHRPLQVYQDDQGRIVVANLQNQEVAHSQPLGYVARPWVDVNTEWIIVGGMNSYDHLKIFRMGSLPELQLLLDEPGGFGCHFSQQGWVHAVANGPTYLLHYRSRLDPLTILDPDARLALPVAPHRLSLRHGRVFIQMGRQQMHRDLWAWDPVTQTVDPQFAQTAEGPRRLEWSTDSRFFFTGDDLGCVETWKYGERPIRLTRWQAHQRRIVWMGFPSHWQWLVTISRSQNLRVWDRWDTDKPVMILELPCSRAPPIIDGNSITVRQGDCFVSYQVVRP